MTILYLNSNIRTSYFYLRKKVRENDIKQYARFYLTVTDEEKEN